MSRGSTVTKLPGGTVLGKIKPTSELFSEYHRRVFPKMSTYPMSDLLLEKYVEKYTLSQNELAVIMNLDHKTIQNIKI